MSAFADTSFLFGIYFARAASPRATSYLQAARSPARISTLVRYEYIQGVWFEVWRRQNGDLRGITAIQAQNALAAFELDVEQGIWEIHAPSLPSIIARAETLTLRHTARHGARSLDLLHIATALETGSREFLTFDEVQSNIAKAEGLELLTS